jgi:hypothetical protein
MIQFDFIAACEIALLPDVHGTIRSLNGFEKARYFFSGE